jgi:hypothetical protein
MCFPLTMYPRWATIDKWVGDILTGESVKSRSYKPLARLILPFVFVVKNTLFRVLFYGCIY